MTAQTSAPVAPISQDPPPGRTPQWAARLTPCGHQTATSGRPRPGGWMSCGTCHDQREIAASWPLGVPAPGEQAVQGQLWDGGEAA